jgi:hypothetical protein
MIKSNLASSLDVSPHALYAVALLEDLSQGECCLQPGTGHFYRTERSRYAH